VTFDPVPGEGALPGFGWPDLGAGGSGANDPQLPVALDERLRAVLATAMEALTLVDDERRYLAVNDAATGLLGAPSEEIIGRRIEDFTPVEDWPRLERLWAELRQRGELEGDYVVLQGKATRRAVVFRARWGFVPGQQLIAALQLPLAGTHTARRAAALAGERRPRLSERELEVLQLVADGCTNEQVAERLVVSPATVKTHLQHVYEKLGTGQRAFAVAAALRLGLIS
jgi:PAS domain S-box-containing protein